MRSPLASNVDAPPPDAEFVGSAPAPPDEIHGISESAFAPQYFEKFFVIEKELGRGGRGVVLLVKHVLDNVTLGHFACKRVPVGNNHAWLEKVLVEVQALQSLSHQNLVSYRHVWLEDYKINNFSPSTPCAFILQQYCNGGDLHTYVCAPAQVKCTTQELKERIRRRSRGESEMPQKPNEPRKLHLDEIYSFFLNITEGLRFLHLNGFIHRDLKPSNCLLHQVGGETRVLVSDFGEVQYENTMRKSTGHTGTISYCAPEVLRPVSPGGPFGNFTFKSDVFSLGMILYFLCFADLPYRSADVLHEEQEDLDELRDEITSWSGFDESLKKRSDLPPKLYTFLRKLLAISPENRPTSDDVLQQLKVGNVDLPELTRRSSAGPEDLTPGRRITKIDTSPATSNSAKGHRPRDVDTISPTRHMRMLRPNSPSLTNGRTGSGGEQDDLVFTSDDGQSHSQSSLTALAMTRSSSHGTHVHNHNHGHNHKPTGLNVSNMRSNPKTNTNASTSTAAPPSPPPQPTIPRPSHSPGRCDHTPAQKLLPPPSPTSIPDKLRRLLTQRMGPLSFYIFLFAAKTLSVVQPCLAAGVDDPTVFYAVFALAALELATQPHPVWRCMVLALAHAGVLWYARGRGGWCRTPELDAVRWELET